MTPKLYHAPLACSSAVRIAAAEADLELDLAVLDLSTKQLADGGSFLDVNPLGQVSVLEVQPGVFVSETMAVIMWVQSHGNNAEFCRKEDDPQYFQMLRWLGFCATELHKQLYRVVFYDEASAEVKDKFRALVPARFELLDKHLSDRTFLLDERYSAADAYLTWFFVLTERAEVTLDGYRNLSRYRDQVLSRPKVAQVIEDDVARRA